LVSEKFSTELKLGINSGGIALPSGAIQGQNVVLALQALTSHVAHVHDFDAFPIPFRAVATDIVTGDMVVLSGGDLARAMEQIAAMPAGQRNNMGEAAMELARRRYDWDAIVGQYEQLFKKMVQSRDRQGAAG